MRSTARDAPPLVCGPRASSSSASRRSYRSRPSSLAQSTLMVVLLQILLLLGAMQEIDALPQHQQRFLSESYEKHARASPDAAFHLAIGLHVADFDALERQLWHVSNPQATGYGRHLSREQADYLARPRDGALEAVQDWLRPFVDARNDVGTFSPASNILKVSMPIKSVELLFGTEVHEYLNEEGQHGTRILRAAREISIPEHLHSVISFVNVNAHPLGLRALASMSPSTAASAQKAGVASSSGGTLAQIRDLYHIPGDLVVTNASNTQCVPSFYKESWNPEDLAKFVNEYLPGNPVPTVVAKGTRANVPESASTEASLDIQYITGVARNATTYMWTMNGSNPYSPQDEPFVEFVQGILEMEIPPLVVSISYSDDEAQIFRLSPDYARIFDALLIKMGLRGITVLIASGDDGVAGLRPEFSKLPRNETCLLAGPQWPSSSPYITSVGATMQLHQSDFDKDFFRTDEEVVCSGQTGGIVTGGGGFSNVYPIPEYQRTAVARYLQTRRIPKSLGYFNKTGRAYPDISALGASFHVYIHGYVTSVSGTSASTPVVGAMVTLWNDARLNAGKSPLGFINPLLYFMAEVNPSAFNDVVIGNNGARKGGAMICDESFGAAGGWDAASGVGTPNFPMFLEFIMGLEDKFNLTTPLEYTSRCDLSRSKNSSSTDSTNADSTTNLNANAAGGDSGRKSNSSNAFSTVVLATAVVMVAIVGLVVLTVAFKRWRNQYTSLSADASPNLNLKRSPKRHVSPDANSNSNSGVANGGGLEEGKEEDDGNRNDVEMSEISLHE